jgi:hypothetical protein
MSRTFPHCDGTPQVVASPSRARAVTRARTMRRSFRAHAYPPSHTPHACPRSVSQGCTLGWYALTLWVKRHLGLMAAPRLAPIVASPRRARAVTRARTMRRSFRAHAYPPSHTPHACPRSVSQGCTLGWYASTLWAIRAVFSEVAHAVHVAWRSRGRCQRGSWGGPVEG